MKIIIHSNAPWVPTAYGQQAALWAPRLASLGHEVLVSAFFGLAGGPLTWEGVTVLPGNSHGDAYGSQILAEHARHEHADLVITLMDVWVLDPNILAKLPVAAWLPIDCTPLSTLDAVTMQASGAVPVAMSRFGETRLREAGFKPLFVPHGLHPVYTGQLPDRAAARAKFGLGDKFAVGINAANKDAFRKGMFEQLAAFTQFHSRHPDSVLMIHGLAVEHGALDLLAMARQLGIAPAVHFVDQYGYLSGRIPVEHLRDWYTALDLYSACSMGEGFCLPLVEAQACGVPVVITDGSAMRENCGAGWTVPGERFWNASHRACWVKPDISAIARAYEKAYERGPAYHARKAKAREFAMAFEADRVLHEYWKPALEQLGARLRVKA